MPNIRHEVLVAASPEKVFDSIASQEGLSGWWTPDVSAKAEVGSIARIPFGPNYFKEMKIVALEPAKRIQWKCIAGADEWVGTKISFELHGGESSALLKSHPEAADQIRQSDRDRGTILVLEHDDWREYTAMFAECNYTWGQFLRSLKLLCETGKGRPWPHEHRAET